MWLVMPENICCISGLLFHPLSLLQFLKNTYCLWIENKSQIECNRFFLQQVWNIRHNLNWFSEQFVFWIFCCCHCCVKTWTTSWSYNGYFLLLIVLTFLSHLFQTTCTDLCHYAALVTWMRELGIEEAEQIYRCPLFRPCSHAIAAGGRGLIINI